MLPQFQSGFSGIKSGLFAPLIALIILFAGTHEVKAQITKIRGKVTDAVTGEGLPFVNVYFKGTTTGSTTDEQGYYAIETRHAADSLAASSVGYLTRVKPVIRNRFQEINFNLQPDQISLSEVVIKAGENPAEILLRKVIENKPLNDRENLEYYQFEAYTKIGFDANNLSEKFMNRKILKPFAFIFDYIDTSSYTGKAYLPVFLSESLSDVYYRNTPRTRREVIKASRVSGIDNASISQLLGDMIQQVNIYDNYITLFQKNFVSPLAGTALFSYRYYLVDSAYVDGHWCYKMAFKPRRKQEFTFHGDIWIHDSTFAVKQFEMHIAGDANINFINDLVLFQEFELVSGRHWMLAKDKLLVDFNITQRDSARNIGFFGSKTSSYRGFVINQPREKAFYNTPTTTMVDEAAGIKDDAFWADARHEALTRREDMVYQMVDTLRSLPVFKTWVDIVQMVTTGYYVHGNMEWGPYMSTYSFNQLEGHRFRLSGRTSNHFSTKLMLEGYTAYGLADQQIKYSGGFTYMIGKNPRRVVSGAVKYDVEQLGQSQNAFREDFLLASLFRRNPADKLSMVHQYKGYYEHEWFTGLSNTFSFTQRSLWSSGRVPFSIHCDNGDCLKHTDVIRTSEFSINTRFAMHEKVVMGEFERVSLGGKYPVLEINYTYGIPGLFSGDFEYHRLQLSLRHWFNILSWGWSKYNIEAGKIWGKVPYPLLKIHPGNETYVYDESAFNLMNYYEFISDQYISFYYTHHFVGAFFNKIPVFRKLKWREVAQVKGVIGNVTKENLAFSALPAGTYTTWKPYVEAGLGIENIFRIFRVDAVWRLSYYDHTDINKFGVMVSMQFDF
ncbi:hypothetical protein TBC1_111743 [Lentimicrobium saccharophilum]|uniref:Carboxypeptidase-like regulatory domain-containing protein n=2 Tax=Lentimicrobium saccharophilum TaxID=1678841 RepID=A0A0S7C3V5_9BACT|nr:hypothetical protein TBC1_111743 [Lentimicrobium saccharophilum]